MFKVLPDIEVKLERVPGWVWACLMIAVFFFGTLYMVPEARQRMGELFSAPADEASRQGARTEPPKTEKRTTGASGSYPSKAGRLRFACGAANVQGELMTMTDGTKQIVYGCPSTNCF